MKRSAAYIGLIGALALAGALGAAPAVRADTSMAARQLSQGAPGDNANRRPGTATSRVRAGAGGRWVSERNPYSGTNRDLLGLSCPTSTDCYAGGYGIVATTDGRTWTLQTDANKGYINGLACATPARCVAVSGSGEALTTTDGGAAWAIRTATKAALDDVACPSATMCVAVGEQGAILTSADGGATWRSRPNPDSGKARHNFLAVTCPSARDCYAVGYSTLATTDGGASWHAQTGSPQYYLAGVACGDTKTCLAVGEHGTIIETRDGGATWAARRSGTTTYLHRVTCAAGLRACTITGANGLILSSGDGGATWRPQASGTTQPLWGVACPGTVCYAVGHRGAILKLSGS